MSEGEGVGPKATHSAACASRQGRLAGGPGGSDGAARGLPGGLRLVCEIDVFHDVGLLQKMGVWSGAILVAGIAAIALAAALGIAPEPLSWAWLAGLVAATAASFAIHELVHGLFFRLLGGRGTRIRFGARQGMLYTRAEGLMLPVRRFVVVLLAPAVLVSATTVAVGWAAGLPLAAAIVFVLHLSGCVGDFAFVQAIFESDADLAEDTETGMRLYAAAYADGVVPAAAACRMRR
ncbi:MAG: DUF3267 domain-containing protein [Atopobiaceae bacterium]|jgi:hypothetical protein|nr:DUF3267 domain-containing protein [Atopobiaceae bacterium]MCH4119541.1 DUF3267 domain-containing protein [Atopobiaceae bacterium]MCI1317899.1 DUF3267 domain-containing protein [Atopobiaceae bacterium]MCI1389574.1 DUF3267 domain-containing protein [Atopobiaceae bacterium]MCI1431638.1 DUF3267 domain-containing protein [Atopobiaceae bacterium]